MKTQKYMTDEIINTVKDYLKENGIDSEKVNLHTNLIKDFDLDSLDFLDLFSILEKKFSVQIPDKTLNYKLLLSLSDLVDYIICQRRKNESKI